MKILMFDGRLAADAETKVSSNDRAYVRFRVGSTNQIKGEPKTDWFEVISFNEGHVKFAQYLKKGSHVFVSGTPDTVVNPGKDGRLYVNTSVLANSIDFVSGGGKKDKENGDEPEIKVTQDAKPEQTTNYQEAEQAFVQKVESIVPPSETSDAGDDDDELPF